MRKRKVWVEPLFAEAKDWHGMRRFRLRRLWRVNCEAQVIAAGQNLKRLLKKRGWGRRLFPTETLSASFFYFLRVLLVSGQRIFHKRVSDGIHEPVFSKGELVLPPTSSAFPACSCDASFTKDELIGGFFNRLAGYCAFVFEQCYENGFMAF